MSEKRHKINKFANYQNIIARKSPAFDRHVFVSSRKKAKFRRTDETKQYDTITSPILKGKLEQKLIEAKENLEKMYENKTRELSYGPKPAGIMKVKKMQNTFST